MYAVALGGALAPARARACGPCTVPELWGIEELRGEPVVVANFGLLHRDNGAWRVTCEEIMGGLLLDARGNERASFVSTEFGLFQQSGDLCEWSAGPSNASNTWTLDLALARHGSTTDSFALVVDFETQRLNVEHSREGRDFTIVHSFEQTSGYRELETGGDSRAVFVSGHGGQPRVWKLAFSLDAGESWHESTPHAEGELVGMQLQALHPRAPRSVFVRREMPEGQGDELWLFDAERDAAERLLTLEDGERFAGLTFNGDTAWVAGRRADAGSLYRAAEGDLDFTRVVEAGPAFDCLSAHDGVLYACVNDFTYASQFVLASSSDDGATWQAEMTLEDLGSLASCGAECRATLDWLRESYGDRRVGVAGSSSDGCAAQSTAPSREHLAWTVGLSALLLVLRRRRAQRVRMRRALSITGTLLVLLACSEDGAEDTAPGAGVSGNEAGAAGDGCAGRGDDLSALELETDGGLRLRLIDTSPDPPAVGDNSWLIELSDAQGQVLSGLAETILVTPFMPDHGHGTPVAVGVDEERAGVYRLAPVNTFMPGLWQMEIRLSGGEEPQTLEFSVCVR